MKDAGLQTWTMVDLDGKPVIPVHDSNVGDWLHEINLVDYETPHFWRVR